AILLPLQLVQLALQVGELVRQGDLLLNRAGLLQPRFGDRQDLLSHSPVVRPRRCEPCLRPRQLEVQVYRSISTRELLPDALPRLKERDPVLVPEPTLAEALRVKIVDGTEVANVVSIPRRVAGERTRETHRRRDRRVIERCRGSRT